MQFSVRALRKDAGVTPTIFFSLILKDKLLQKKKEKKSPPSNLFDLRGFNVVLSQNLRTLLT